MKLCWLILLWVGIGAMPVWGAGADVDVQLMADTSAVVSGHSFTMAIVLTTSPRWHIYWKNPGDAGLATKIVLTAPAGYEVGPIEFPLPMKFNEPGGIVDFGYTGRAIFLAKVLPGKDVPLGKKVEFTAKVSWLCCSERCVPGRNTVSVSLPTGDHANSANDQAFREARAAMPAEGPFIPPTAVGSITSDKSDSSMGIDIGWKQGVEEVDVFPETVEGVDIGNMRSETHGVKTRIAFDARLMANAKWPEHLRVLVVYKDGQHERHGFYADLLHLTATP